MGLGGAEAELLRQVLGQALWVQVQRCFAWLVVAGILEGQVFEEQLLEQQVQG